MNPKPYAPAVDRDDSIPVEIAPRMVEPRQPASGLGVTLAMKLESTNGYWYVRMKLHSRGELVRHITSGHLLDSWTTARESMYVLDVESKAMPLVATLKARPTALVYGENATRAHHEHVIRIPTRVLSRDESPGD